MSVKVLILGATGMLGHTLMQQLSQVQGYTVFGTVRKAKGLNGYFDRDTLKNIIPGIEANDTSTVKELILKEKPHAVINCIGIVKQLKAAYDPVPSIGINALFPHQLAAICAETGARLIHISTDCVFSGTRGNYTEQDVSDAVDLYGRTKYLGELSAYDHCITLRTSIIGHELETHYGLIEWFLAQRGEVKGFTRAIYTGFPTVELARIIAEYIIPNPALKGLYQIAADPINKYELLKLVAQAYGKNIRIQPDDQFFCDRSLNGRKFADATGYQAPAWPELVRRMHAHFVSSSFYRKPVTS